MSEIHDRVAARCAQADIPVTAAGVAEIERFLREEGSCPRCGRTRAAFCGICEQGACPWGGDR